MKNRIGSDNGTQILGIGAPRERTDVSGQVSKPRDFDAFLSLEESDNEGPSTRVPGQTAGVCLNDQPYATIFGTPTSDLTDTGEDALCTLLDEGFTFTGTGANLGISHKDLPKMVLPFCAEAIEEIRKKVAERNERLAAIGAMKAVDKAADRELRGPSLEERLSAAKSRNGKTTSKLFEIKKTGRYTFVAIPANARAKGQMVEAREAEIVEAPGAASMTAAG